jgi:hypothetical protein
MWGPYSRQPYSRPGILYQVYSQTCQATVEFVGSLSAAMISLLTLAATFIATPRIVRIMVGKLLQSTVEFSGSVVKSMGKALSATVEFVADLSMIKSFLRTLSTTVEFVGSFTRDFYISLAATVEFKISRLRARNRYGFEFTGNFPDESEIIIDRDTWTVTLNGANALHLIEGDPPFFVDGSNVLTYSDDEGSRTVTIKAIYRGRWL